jgi:hypothetical protein
VQPKRASFCSPTTDNQQQSCFVIENGLFSVFNAPWWQQGTQRFVRQMRAAFKDHQPHPSQPHPSKCRSFACSQHALQQASNVAALNQQGMDPDPATQHLGDQGLWSSTGLDHRWEQQLIQTGALPSKRKAVTKHATVC